MSEQASKNPHHLIPLFEEGDVLVKKRSSKARFATSIILLFGAIMHALASLSEIGSQ